MKWFRKAADQGDADGQWHLAMCYLSSVTKDYEEAVKWFRKAADQGLANGRTIALAKCILKARASGATT